MASGNIGASVTESTEGGSWGGFTVDLTLTHNATNTAFVNGDISFSSISVNLNIDGRQSSMSLRDFLALFGYETSMFTIIRAWTSYSSVLVAAAVGVAEKRKLSMRFEFPKPVQLTSDKKISVTLNPGNAFSNTNAASTMDVQLFEGFGISAGYPKFTKVAAESGASSKTATILPNTSKIIAYEHSKSDMLEATQVITGVALNTEKGQLNLTYGELIALRNTFFQNATDTANRYQNYRLDPGTKTGTDFDSGTVTVSYSSANVSSDATGILMASMEVTDGSFTRFSERRKKFEARDFAKLPVTVQQRIRQIRR